MPDVQPIDLPPELLKLAEESVLQIRAERAAAEVRYHQHRAARPLRLDRSDDQLYLDLQTAWQSRKKIGPEQRRLQILIDRAKAEGNTVKAAAHQWQFDTVAAQLTRASDIAAERLHHLAVVEMGGAAGMKQELLKCKGDTLYWFKWWAWSLDPRQDAPLAITPFVPFPFQENYLRWLKDIVFVERTSGMVEKTRDAGATVGFLLWVVKQWLFRDHFSAFLTSATEDLVDSQKDPDTLFEKVRFQLRRTPSWMLPVGFKLKRDMPYMQINNPHTGGSITGGAPTMNVGRQRRRTVVLKDESASWPYGGYPQHTSLSQTSRSTIDVSSVKGEANKFAELRRAGKTPCFVMDWWDHPWKDERWFNALSHGYVGPAMDSIQIAQEILRDYRASMPGPIFPEFSEPWHVITWSDFEAVYKVRHIPTTWNLARAQDVGTTGPEQHPNVTAWCARPPLNDRLSDSLFFYREFVAPTKWSNRDIADGKWGMDGKLTEPGIMQREMPLRESERMTLSLISWEGESERRTYAQDSGKYRIDFARIQRPGPNDGIAQARNLISLLPEAHPFVHHPRTGDPLSGRPRLYFIVADDQGELFENDQGQLMRRPALNEDGLARARFEMPRYHYPVTEKDKPVGKRKPFKRDDDFIDDLRYICRAWGPPVAEESIREQIENLLPDSLKSANLPAIAADTEMDLGEWSMMMDQRDKAAARIERELGEQEAMHWRRRQTGRRETRWKYR